MEMENLQDLFVAQLKDLYSAENQLLKALPKVAKAASNEMLKQAVLDHLEETKNQVARLEQIFERLGESPKGKTCQAMKGLVAEGTETMGEDADEDVMDAALIADCQRIEHYEMAGYGTVRSYAKTLGDKESMELLTETLDEEGLADKKLNKLAEQIINLKAAKK